MSNVATLFGLGRLGFAPGTLGSLVALPIAWLVMRFGGMYALLGVTAVVAIAAIWVSDAYAKESGDEDPQDCIIDEVAGQMLACALAPLSLAGFALAFVLFRLFDISKLWPISAVERIGGGAGIVGDDMLAGLIAGIVVATAATAGLI
jgi:phosphatidylglycerophosphatase A